MLRMASLLLILAPSAFAWTDEAKTAAEDLPSAVSQEGWLSLFDGLTTFGWKCEGNCDVIDNCLRAGGAEPTNLATTASFGDFDLQLTYSVTGEQVPALVLNGAKHELRIKPSSQVRTVAVFRVRSTGDHHTVDKQESQEGESLSGQVTATVDAPKVSGASRTPIEFHVPAGTKLTLHSIRLLPQGLEPIFNGRDLSGWKPIPDKKSKFAVTQEGELNITDGPGDLHSEGQWGDFILQLDIKSNGQHLNSGVFFRCVPLEFWSGYEAQIRNQWHGEERSKPVDFGTGGLYNRQRARKVVSSDHEWFTMTVLACGKHIAIWVNGYQTVDFTETKPLGDNARRGGKVTPGTLSLQGHDPSTDLSFKRIRIASLPETAKGGDQP